MSVRTEEVVDEQFTRISAGGNCLRRRRSKDAEIESENEGGSHDGRWAQGR